MFTNFFRPRCQHIVPSESLQTNCLLQETQPIGCIRSASQLPSCWPYLNNYFHTFEHPIPECLLVFWTFDDQFHKKLAVLHGFSLQAHNNCGQFKALTLARNEYTKFDSRRGHLAAARLCLRTWSVCACLTNNVQTNTVRKNTLN